MLEQNEHAYVYLFGGCFDPTEGNEDVFCTQLFPISLVEEIYCESDAIKEVVEDFTAEVYKVDKSTGHAARITHRVRESVVFPLTLTADYLKSD